jgi:hypothetical protein
MMKKNEFMRCDILVTNSFCFKGKITLPSNQTYKLIIDYPVSLTYVKNIKTGKTGKDSVDIIRAIGVAYTHVYNDTEKYGIWGHDMDDLVIEGIKVNHTKKIIELLIGS